RKPKTCCLRDSFRPERKATNYRNAPATQLRSVWRVTSPAIERAADTMLAAGTGYEPHRNDHSEGTDRANQGKLPLRPDAIRGERGAGRRDPLHLFAVFETRRAVGLLHAGAVPPDLAA